MSAPLFDDAAFRYTDASQEYTHLLGSKLRRPVADTAQVVHAWNSADLTARRVVAIGSGVEDLRAQLRYDGMTQSLRSFLAAARRGASLEYFPSLANPSESYPCELIGDDGIELDADFWWNRRNAVGLHLRRIDGGSWVGLLEGSLFYYRGGNDAPGLTFARSSTATYTDEAGVIQTAAANIWRTEWLDMDSDGQKEAPAYLGGPARTNLVDSDDLTAWSVSGTPVITGSVSGPAGGTGAYSVEDNDGAAAEFPLRTITFTGDAVKSLVFAVRENTMPATGVQRLRVRDTTAAADRLMAGITGWTAGAPSVTATTGTYLGRRYIGNGYWAIYCQTSAITAANTNQVSILPAETAAETGIIDVYRVNAYDNEIPDFSILDASDAKTADTWYADIGFGQQAMTLYVRMLEFGTAFGDETRGIVHLGGSSGSTGPYLQLNSVTSVDGRYRLDYHNGTAEVTAQIGSGDAVSFGDETEVLCHLDYNEDEAGDIRISQSANGGTVTTPVTTAGPAGGFETGDPFNAARAYLSSLGSTNHGINPLIEVKLLPGIKTMAEARAA